MRKEFIFIFGLILSISFVLAIPPQPHAFYGKVEYNGESIPGGCSIEAKLNDFSKQCLITDEGYGYGTNTCIITDEGKQVISNKSLLESALSTGCTLLGKAPIISLSYPTSTLYL